MPPHLLTRVLDKLRSCYLVPAPTPPKWGLNKGNLGIYSPICLIRDDVFQPTPL